MVGRAHLALSPTGPLPRQARRPAPGARATSSPWRDFRQVTWFLQVSAFSPATSVPIDQNISPENEICGGAGQVRKLPENCGPAPCLRQGYRSGFVDVRAVEGVASMKTTQWPASRPPAPLHGRPGPSSVRRLSTSLSGHGHWEGTHHFVHSIQAGKAYLRDGPVGRRGPSSLFPSSGAAPHERQSPCSTSVGQQVSRQTI